MLARQLSAYRLLFHVKHQTIPPFIVSRETYEKLGVFARLFERWAKRINLIGHNDLDQLWSRHIEDSLQLAPLVMGYMPPLLDLGSGGGFPGLILAIATRQRFELVEADQRKAAFLREAIRLTEASACVHAKRIEKLDVPPVSLITARAFAPINELLNASSRFLTPDGIVLLLKGRTAAAELTRAEPQWHMRVRIWQSRTNPEGQILQLSEIARVKSHGGLRPASKL